MHLGLQSKATKLWPQTTAHLGDCVIARVYFWIKYMMYWKEHKCPLYFPSLSFSGLPVISRAITQECSNTKYIIQSRFILYNARNKLQTIIHSFSKSFHLHYSYINLWILCLKKNVLSSRFTNFYNFCYKKIIKLNTGKETASKEDLCCCKLIV